MKNVDFLISWKAINPFLPDIDYSEILLPFKLSTYS